MYSRSYAEEVSHEAKCTVKVPQGYDGNAIFELPPRVPERPTCEPDTDADSATEEHKSEGRPSFISDILSRLSPKKCGSGILAHVGIEEILLISLALFLFFSEEGDRECALFILILLLF